MNAKQIQTSELPEKAKLLLDYLKELIEGECYKCEESGTPCEFSTKHEDFYWLHHPVSYSIQKHGWDTTIFLPEKIQSHITGSDKNETAIFALVFDGNGLFEYIELFENKIWEWAREQGLYFEKYHHWNMLFYEESGIYSRKDSEI